MKPSQSAIHTIRGLRYHVRTWGVLGHEQLFLLHGWMDVSASFQFLVDALKHDWQVIAPDWRGFGLSEWSDDVYWFPDYLGDLDALLGIYSPDRPVNLVGHSLGGNVACLYAGVRPERVGRLVTLEGFGIPRSTPGQAPQRYAKWLDELRDPPGFKPYDSFDAVAERLKKSNPRLPAEKAAFLARHWAKQLDSGEVVLVSDPRHKVVNPVLYRLEESMACWQKIVAPTLWVVAGDSEVEKWLKESPKEFAIRKAAFKNLKEHVIRDAGHMMHHDQPAELARVIEGFLLENL